MNTKSSAVMIALALALCLTGCQVASMTEMGPQSHFTYPNSNVVALGPVKATIKGPSSCTGVGIS